MKSLFKYLKHYISSILIIFGLLLVQAACDLSLPTYTSNIINVGISQNGIEETVPKVIRRNKMLELLNFMSQDEKNKVLANYSFVNTKYERYVKLYPILDSEPIYILNEEYDKEIIDIMQKPMLISSIMSGSNSMLENLNSDIDLSTLTEEEKKLALEEMTKKMDNIPDTYIDALVKNFIKNEYSIVGIDMNKLQTNYIINTGIKMVLISFLSMVSTVMVGFIGARMAASLAKSLRDKIFEKVLSFSNSEIKKFGVASLITRSTNDITQVQNMIVMIIRTVIYAPIIGIGALIKVFAVNSDMAWIIGVAVLSILFIVITLFVFVMPKFTKLQKLVDKLNLVSREILTGILPIRAFANSKHEEERFDDANKALTKVSLFVNKVMSGMMPLMMLVMNVITLMIVWYGAKGIDAGTLELGDMMAFIQYTMQIIMAFLMISMISIMLPRAVVSLKRIDEVILEPLTITSPNNPSKFSSDGKGVVEFRKVSFRYPDADYDVISDISFIAKPGTTTAIIGSTGSGKSTLVNLIPRLFDVTTGEIFIDGVNIKDVELSDLRDRIGYVPQKGVLFSGTIEENIKFANNNITDDEMIMASEISQSKEFIDAKQLKYSSLISQGGTNVSGGQKQRLSIARAIAKNPDIYIFDDSFSALDFKTDRVLREELKKVTKDKTILIVAQRISTIMYADNIIVLDEGSIVGVGTHEELLNNCEVYKEIALSQLGEEDLNRGKETKGSRKQKTADKSTTGTRTTSRKKKTDAKKKK